MTVSLRDDYGILKTEERNPRTAHIDEMSTKQMIDLMCNENRAVEDAVAEESQSISDAVDVITDQLNRGGRVFYVGSGTSGRLGILDAAECPPTFGVSADLFQGIIAGGNDAVFRAAEGAEDSFENGKHDLINRGVTSVDVVVGLSASGGAPYVLGALDYAGQLGAKRIGITCNRSSRMKPMCDVCISPYVGPEVITGSTRLKAGTAQKLVLNMLSTGAMIKTGKVKGNLMINVKPTNDKLRSRCISILSELGNCDILTATDLIDTYHDISVSLSVLASRK